MAQGVPDLRHGGEDRVGGLDQRVEPAEGRQVGAGRGALERRGERAGALSSGRRQNYGCVGVVSALSALAHTAPPDFWAGPCGRSTPRALAALGHRHFFAQHARGVVPLQRFGVVAGNAGEPLVVDLAQPLRRLATARTRGLRVELHRFLAPALAFERGRLLEQAFAGRGAAWRRRRRAGDLLLRALGGELLRRGFLRRHLRLRRGFLGGDAVGGEALALGLERRLLRGKLLARGPVGLGLLLRVGDLALLGGDLVGGELLLLGGFHRVALLPRLGLGARAHFRQLLLLGEIARLLRLGLGGAHLLERDARLFFLLLRLLELRGLLLRVFELPLYRHELLLGLLVAGAEEVHVRAGQRRDQDADDRRIPDRLALAPGLGFRLGDALLEFGLALRELGLGLRFLLGARLEVGLALGLLFRVALRARLGFQLRLRLELGARLGLGLALRLGLGLALLVLGLALRELRSRGLLRLLLGLAARLLRSLALRLGLGLALLVL